MARLSHNTRKNSRWSGTDIAQEHRRQVVDPLLDALRLVGPIAAYKAARARQNGEIVSDVLADAWQEAERDALQELALLGYETSGVTFNAEIRANECPIPAKTLGSLAAVAGSLGSDRRSPAIYLTRGSPFSHYSSVLAGWASPALVTTALSASLSSVKGMTAWATIIDWMLDSDPALRWQVERV